MPKFRLKVSLKRPASILVGGFMLAFLAALGTVLATWSSREVALREWDSRLMAVSRMLAAHADQSVGAADLVLRGITENVNEYRVQDADEMRWVFRSRYIHDVLREAAKGLPQIEVITVASTDGTLLNFTRQFPPPPINLLDRDYFEAHLADPDLDLFVSKPVQNRGNGTWTFYLARKIRSPSGEMLGLVLAGLKVEFFTSFYASIGLGVDRVSLLRGDGALLARHSQRNPSEIVGPSESASVIEQIRETKNGSLFSNGERLEKSGFTELVAYDRSSIMPLALTVSASRTQLLREWEREAVKFVIEGGTMTGVLIAVTMLLSRLIGELEAARNAALAAVDAKTRFASNVSHELRTPMNVIIGGTHHLMQESLTGEARRFAVLVSSAAQQLMFLINDILDYSYYEARNFRIEAAPFDVRMLVRDMVELSRSLGAGKTTVIDGDVDANVPPILVGDAGRIRQALLNLLGNAVKYTDAGLIRLEARYDCEAGILTLTVADTGRGISKEEQNRIFQPFERGRTVSARPGTGLGLTISKTLIEAMSGRLDLESAPAKGARFIIQLPLTVGSTEVSVAPQIEGVVDAPVVQRNLRVLVAEDVAPSRVLLTIMLEKLGHTVIAVENGLEAVRAIQRDDFDLVLMDLQMPELDGLNATRQIRVMGGDKGRVPIIAVSANADLNGPGALASAGFDDSLTKPVTPARLESVVRMVAAAV